MPKLIIHTVSQEWTVDLVPGSNIVGRASQCQVPVKDPSLSRQHCELVLEGQAVRVLDKGSMNGTLLNGKRVLDQVMKPGDRITIGSVTLWLGHKGNMPADRKELPTAQAAPEPPVETHVPTRRAVVVQAAPEPATATVHRPGARAAAAPFLADYAFRSPGGGAWIKVVVAVAVVAALAVGAYVAFGALGGGGGPKAADNNLLLDGSFDYSSGKPDGWSLRTLSGDKPASTLSLGASSGRGGGPCLVLEKSPQPGDLGVECVFQGDFAPEAFGAVEVSASTKFDGYSGWVALKIDWLSKSRGILLAEECSKQRASRCADWTPLSGTFLPPPGASAFRLSLAAVGRGGKIYWDDIRAVAGPGAPDPARDVRLGPHRALFTSQGIHQLEVRPGRVVANAAFRLENLKEGVSSQSSAVDVTLSSDATGVTAKGKLPNPVDLRDVEFEQRLELREGGTDLYYTFQPDALRLVDRVTVMLTLPRVSAVLGLHEGADPAPVDLLTCTSEDGDLFLEYTNPARVKAKMVDGRTRLYQSFPVDLASGILQFGVQIRAGTGRTVTVNPLERADDLVKKKQLGEALVVLETGKDKIKDPAQRDKAEATIKRLRQAERDDWAAVQARHFQAWISLRAEFQQQAGKLLEDYERTWRGPEFLARIQGLREEERRQKEAAGDPDGDLRKRALSYGLKQAELGRKTLARIVLQHVVRRWSQSAEAGEAEQALKSLEN